MQLLKAYRSRRLLIQPPQTSTVIPKENNDMETLKQKIERVTKEKITIDPYNPLWTQMFQNEKDHLLSCIPNELIKRIDHFGSTAIPGLSAKPIIDMLVEVTSLQDTKNIIVPILESQGYDYFWRPTFGDDVPPFYAWFIKRDDNGKRTHHIHMIENNAQFAEHWDRLLFRDYLIEHPGIAKEYERLKLRFANEYEKNRIAYTESKTDFIQRITEMAKENIIKA